MPPLLEHELLRRLGATKLLLGLSCLAAAWWGAAPAALFHSALALLGLAIGASGVTLLLAGSFAGRFTRRARWRMLSLALDFGAIALLFGNGAQAFHLPLEVTLPAWWNAYYMPVLVVIAVVLNGAAAPAEVTIATAAAGMIAGWYVGGLLPAAAAAACVGLAASVAAPMRRHTLPADLPDRLAQAAKSGLAATSAAGARESAPLGETDLQAAVAMLGVDEVAVLVLDSSRRQRIPSGDLHVLRGGRYAVHRVPLDVVGAQEPAALGFLAPGGVDLPANSCVQPLLGQAGVVGRLILPASTRAVTRLGGGHTTRDALLALLATTWSLRLDNHRLASEAEARLLDIVESLITSVEAKDQYTSGHSTRVCRYSLLLAEALGLNGREQDEVGIGAALHDVGKLGIPEQLLSKPAKLDDAEWDVIRSHPKVGARIIDSFNQSEAVLHIIYHHHERFDGTGYPAGLKGEAIPFHARIVAVADALDAMTSSRAYQRNRAVRDAVQELRRHVGTQFDPRIVATLLKVPLAKLEQIAPQVPVSPSAESLTGVPAAAVPAQNPGQPGRSTAVATPWPAPIRLVARP